MFFNNCLIIMENDVFLLLLYYFIAANYSVARHKLKRAEEESDLTSNTEKEEYLKKSRKIRAAKIIDTSSSSNELSDKLSDDFILEIPKIPKSCDMNTHIQKPKMIKDTQKSKSTIKLQ